MKRIKYIFNTQTLQYEKLDTPLRVRLLRLFGFLAASLVTAGLIAFAAFRFIGSPQEKILQSQNRYLRDQYEDLAEKLNEIEIKLADLEKRDNEVYRSIFEADPIPDSARAQLEAEALEIAKIQRMASDQLVPSIQKTLEALLARMKTQEQSYQEVEELVKDKETLLAHTPAIQPVHNRDLNRIASGFGYRIDPIYKTPKLHQGLDFTAPQGTPIYATANGRVSHAGNKGSGYGNHVIIDHGYGYQTLYGHMVRVKVSAGKSVKRGEVIGWVGNTGKSTGPHCHYEVIKFNQRIDPVYFFYNDLTPEQFDRLLKQAASNNQSLD
ncbi:MAG: M23 family metallopeptidase [Bacteroidota bacterium]|jgi:murein DD-endopeptidase MepM/ murein hydrolase activator NlpD